MNSYSAYTPDAICNGIFIVDGVIGSSPDICEVTETNFSIDQCGTDMTFIDKGPEFFDKCGFQLEIAGKKYTPPKLDVSDDDNPCSGHCDLSFLTGLLLFEELEVPVLLIDRFTLWGNNQKIPTRQH
ncbi:unnamed protein product [Penicillium nalgiovense]|nr:unnamed protein product [Penicillium nalgiovense]